MLVLKGNESFVDDCGLSAHSKDQLQIVTAQALIETHTSNVIAVFHQTELLVKGKSILSCLQMDHYGTEINGKSLKLAGGLQRILTDGYKIPLAFHNGISYLNCCIPTTEELTSLPHIIMTLTGTLQHTIMM
jgi:hypothetical protein